MLLARPLLLLALIAAVEAARQKSRDSDEDDSTSSEEVEESEAEWERIACAVYDRCLLAYDERMTDCAHGKEKEADDDDSCYEPIKKHFGALLDKKEKRNQLLRKCYNTGKVVAEKKEKKRSRDAENSGAVGKRHRGSCRQKFGELEQFMNGGKKKKNGKSAQEAKPLGSETCHASAKRLKERCRKIESCCPRVKSCRSQISSHTLSEEMRDLEGKIKEERRLCREKEFLR